jgi:hypothetical protein
LSIRKVLVGIKVANTGAPNNTAAKAQALFQYYLFYGPGFDLSIIFNCKKAGNAAKLRSLYNPLVSQVAAY